MKNQRGLAILLGLSLVFWPQGVVLATTQSRHPGLAPVLRSLHGEGRIQDRILDSGLPVPDFDGQGVASGAPQNDGTKGLVLSLPFAVASQWTSVGDNIPGITWQTASVPLLPEEGLGEEGVQITNYTSHPTSPPTGGEIDNSSPAKGRLGEARRLVRRSFSEDGSSNRAKTGGDSIKFGVKNGQFIANETDTWFVYGWFGALEAIKQPYNVKYPEWGDRHNGVDFAGREGLEIISANPGKVIFAGQKIGNTVIVDAGNNYQITYGHLQDISVRKGQILQIGDPIGHLGKTGTVNPHLHFQVDLINGSTNSPLHRTAINPIPLFDAEWGNVIIPDAEANQFYTDNQNPLSQPDFIW